MAAETQYTANTAMVTISTANSNLDGSGTLGTILTGASNGTLIKTVTIKATGDTSFGMIRFFVYEGTNTKILFEVNVPDMNQTNREPAFEVTVPVNYVLKSGGILKAATQNAESFNIIAEGLDWAYYGSVRPESTKYTANTGLVNIATANANLNGTGTMGTVLTAALNGTLIQSIVIKATASTSPGMIRLFIYDGANTKLFREIPVPYSTPSASVNSFSHRIDFGGIDFALKTGWVLKASTENAESFNVIAEGLNWEYPA